jgi:hypothetical protein
MNRLSYAQLGRTVFLISYMGEPSILSASKVNRLFYPPLGRNPLSYPPLGRNRLFYPPLGRTVFLICY